MLRFPLAVLVVFIHGLRTAIDVERLQVCGLSGMAVYDYIRIFMSETISRSAVPLFFLFSGFLLFKGAGHYDMKTYTGKLRKRWHTLAVPYIAWNVLCLLWTLAFKVGGIFLHGKPWSGIGVFFMENGWLHMLWDSSVWEKRTTWLGNETAYSSPLLFTFWYMRDLMVLVVLSPVIHWLIRRLRIAFMLLLFAAYFLDIRPSWYSASIVPAALFFCIGAYFSIRKQDFTETLWRGRHIICPLTVALIIIQTATGSDIGDSTSKAIHLWLVVIQSFAFIIAASYLCRFRRLYEWNRKLAAASFFVYAFHPFIQGYVIKLTTELTPMSDTWYMLTADYLIAQLACVAVCVAVYRTGMRWMPAVMNVIMGERKSAKNK